jgi:hypothetical protein
VCVCVCFAFKEKRTIKISYAQILYVTKLGGRVSPTRARYVIK